MTRLQVRTIIFKVHFIFVGIALFNFLLRISIELSLNYRLAYFITALAYATGIVLFFWSLNPFKKVAIYFGVYMMTPLVTLLFWCFGGIFLAILASVVLYPVYPNQIEKEDKNHVIYLQYQGFMGPCCAYEVTEKKFLLLERRITELNFSEAIDFRKASITSANGKPQLRVRYTAFDYHAGRALPADTVITLGEE